MKQCRTCKIEKEISFFRKRENNYYISECTECLKYSRSERYKLNKLNIRKKQKQYYIDNKETILKNQKEYYNRTIEKQRINRKEYQRKNSDKHLNSCRKYRQKNKGLVTFWTRKRQTAKLKRTPNWVNLKEIEIIYKNCPKEMVVDHIIPLQNKNISGLNVPWNLQYITDFENSSKNNKFDFTYENKGWKNG